MADYQTDVLDHVARVIGGTVSSNDPHFFSGAIAQDSTGVAGLTGCYSAAPDDIQALPVGILLAGPFDAELAATGFEENADELRLLILVGEYHKESQMAQLTPFRDSVPAAFRAHMTAFGIPGAVDCFVAHGDPGVHVWGGTEYLAWEFKIRTRRGLAVTYTS